MMTSIKNRRTIRKYTSQEVPDSLLEELIVSSTRAATMGNMQLYSVVVTHDKDMKEALSPLHFNQPMVKGAPVILTFCADFNRFCKWCEYRDAEPGYDNLLSFFNAMFDTLLFAQNFCTLAEKAGLGTCYLGTTLYKPAEIVDVLKLPKLTFPIATVTVGYPDESPEQPDRLPVAAIMHKEVYEDYTEEAINRLFAYKESLAVNKHFVEINGKETLAQVFTDLRYTKSDNEAMSATLYEALRKQGFLK